MPSPAMNVFSIVLIKPTHYDDRGYPIRWYRSVIPSNSLATVNGLAADAARRHVLGPSTTIRIVAMDESNQRVDAASVIAQVRAGGAGGLVALVGVQTNQYPRAMDLARVFRAAGIQVAIGGFHVSGCVAMLPSLPPELRAAQELGVGLFAGEAEEGRLDEVIRDAFDGRLKPLYDHVASQPSLQGQPLPTLGKDLVERTYNSYSSFDLGRGCPFSCSFCTIINVQGKKSRFRSADDLERIVRENRAQGIDRFFLTDDNLARNKNWEACLDRLIELREEGLPVRLIAQVDVKCHKIRGFVDRAVKAGVDQVFIGLESVSPQNLAAVGKRQNNVGQYREMMLAWKRHPVVITAGYIIGFPGDTPESIRRDVEVLKHELPLDVVYFTYLTPLPGSADHQQFVEQGLWLDDDLNRYDLNHRVTKHPLMSDREWDQAYVDAWKSFYTFDHMTTVLRRMVALGSNKKLTTINRLMWHRDFQRCHNVHPLEGGLFRMIRRGDRRPDLPPEGWPAFARYWLQQCLLAPLRMSVTSLRLRLTLWRIRRDPASREWRDAAITRDIEGNAMPRKDVIDIVATSV